MTATWLPSRSSDLASDAPTRPQPMTTTCTNRPPPRCGCTVPGGGDEGPPQPPNAPMDRFVPQPTDDCSEAVTTSPRLSRCVQACDRGQTASPRPTLPQ